MVDRHNAELANGIGPPGVRVLAMLASYFEGEVPEPAVEGAESDLPQVVADATRRYDEEMIAVRPTAALAAVYDVVVRRQSLHGRTEPVDARQGSRAASRARLDPVRIRGDAPGPRDPALSGDAGAAQRLWDQLGTGQTLESQRLAHAGPGDGSRRDR